MEQRHGLEQRERGRRRGGPATKTGFVGQPQVVAQTGGLCQVTVESETGGAWYFVLGQTGGWNVNLLP
ncbi:MAG TPA: hypothetical protein VMU09_07675 [Acidimicrobiales bacterium]|nr:hypothetical protein [Acidimicrobiales bacterium]